MSAYFPSETVWDRLNSRLEAMATLTLALALATLAVLLSLTFTFSIRWSQRLARDDMGGTVILDTAYHRSGAFNWFVRFSES